MGDGYRSEVWSFSYLSGCEETAARIAETLVVERLAASVPPVPGTTSIRGEIRWNGILRRSC